jgi:hypothetical protein
MLSPHEFATLMLIKHGHKPQQLDRFEVRTLQTHRLITLEQRESEYVNARVTPRGDSVLRAIARLPQFAPLPPLPPLR